MLQAGGKNVLENKQTKKGEFTNPKVGTFTKIG